MLAEIAWQRNRDKPVGDDEAVRGERAQPAVNVQTVIAAKRENYYRQDGGGTGDHDRAMGSFVARMRSAERIVRDAIVSHQQQDARRGSDACECPGGQADEQADVDQMTQEWEAALDCEHVHRGLAGS